MNKKPILLLFLVPLLLTGCSNIRNTSSNTSGTSGQTGDTSGNPSTSSRNGQEASQNTNPESQEIEPTTSIQDMTILHVWNWKMTDIVTRLNSIKKAGYGAIQISPMQPKVDKNSWSDQNTSSQWWKIYQPLAFKVATENETFLGTKSQLTTLCSEAKKQNIKVIVDVVTNHLAGNGSGYNDQVYTKYPLHNYGSGADDNNGKSVVQGHIGLPDIDTSNNQVQNDVLNMLKEYIDCGISGFRFDAAKHIETPTDPDDYKSNFWTTVLDGTTAYAQEKNLDKPYYYGEVLNTPGAGRNWSSYTNLMSICDNKQGTDIVNAVNSKNTGSIKTSYNTGVDPDHLVLWAESHDTYANNGGYEITRSFPTETINKAYMIQASRKDAASLYFARPTNMGVTICSIDDDTGWKNNEVAAINQFHTRYVGKNESISIDDNKYFVNVRGTGSFAGAAIVNVNGSNSAIINVPGLEDGNYVDLISNQTFVVSNQKVNVTFTNGGCILIPGEGGSTPSSEVSYDSQVVINNYDPDLYYYAWIFDSSTGEVDKFIKLNLDHDAIGFNIGSYRKFTIAEKNSDEASWNNVVWQSVDYIFSDIATNNQAILNRSTMVKRT